MAKRYQKRPSEILNIDYDLLAYMFDEVALFIEGEATEKDGTINWNKIRWASTSKPRNNDEFIKFIKKQQKQVPEEGR